MNVSSNAPLASIPMDLQSVPADFLRRPSFREMLDALPVAVYTTDAEGRLTYFNPAAAEFAGREPVPGRDRWCVTWKLYHPDGTPMPIEDWPMSIALRERRAVRDVQAIAERPDGTRIWFEPSPTPLFDENGDLIGGINVLLDITERKTGESAQARLASIVESSDDAIISKNLDSIITSWNAGAERIFGYTAEEAIGQSVTMLIPPERHDEEPDILRHIRRGERMDHYDTVRRHKDGTLLNVSLTVSPLFDGAGRIVGASKIARDVTDRKRAEDALHDADRRKDEFLAILAHELRNPLAPILNAMPILQLAGRDADTLKQTREMIERQLNHMVRLIDDLLDVSRISRGRIELKREEVDLATLVRHSVDAFRIPCELKGIDLTVTLPARPVLVDGDPARLLQAIGNLLNNSAKFTERGGSIRLSVAREGAQALIRVEDTGIGIAPEHLSRIFELFTQADSSLERAHGGLGIGLTLAKRLVEMHAGSLGASSAGLGKGAQFDIRLPVVEPPPQAPRAQTGTDTEGAPVTPRTILVVDDNRDAADSLALLLKISGHQVHTANDGLEAVERAEAIRPDVILLDIGLPKMNGYEAARLIRGQEANRNVTLVALTGLGQDKDRRRSLEAGFDAHIIKPVSLSALTKLLAEHDRK